MPSGLVFNIQKYSVHDGPGIRTTVFLKGCPLRCSWCHNPEGISPRRELLVIESRCLACGQCRLACPFGESFAGDGVLPTRHVECSLCAECVEACPTGARQIAGHEMTVADVVREVEKDQVFYEDSGGGVTFSGGEPLQQPEFLRAALEACRARGWHTTVDTCGFVAATDLLAIAPLTDLFLYDLKCMDARKHRQHCGVSNIPILENLRALSQVHRRIWLRVPLVPGVNDTINDIEDLARFAHSLPNVQQVNLLPYHPTGLPKRRRLGHASAGESISIPTAELLQGAANVFRKFNLPVRIGG